MTTLTALALLAALSGAPPTATLEAQIGPLESTEGAVGCLLFARATGFPSEPKLAQARQRHPARTTYVSCRFEGLAPGEYAIAVMHDADDDGELDTNFLGIPSEGYGASNNKLPSMSAPSFEDARVRVAVGETRKLTITVKY